MSGDRDSLGECLTEAYPTPDLARNSVTIPCTGPGLGEGLALPQRVVVGREPVDVLRDLPRRSHAPFVVRAWWKSSRAQVMRTG